jgi:hypothetical protein
LLSVLDAAQLGVPHHKTVGLPLNDHRRGKQWLAMIDLSKDPELLICERPVCGMAMYAFLYRCPVTGHKVQGLVRDNPAAPDDTTTYETLTCSACGRVHLVNPSTGHVAGADTSSSALAAAEKSVRA